MIRTILALGDGALSKTVTATLTQHGIDVRYHCSSGADILRAVKKMGGGVILCTFRLPDMTANGLADALDTKAQILVLGKGKDLALCDHPSLFKMTVPVRASELLGAVHILLQADAMVASRKQAARSDEAQALISAAKAHLMQQYGYSEPEAHRALQRRSMNHCQPMAEAARDILQSLDDQ